MNALAPKVVLVTAVALAGTVLAACGADNTSSSSNNASAASLLDNVDWQSGLGPASEATVDGDKVSIDVGNGFTLEHDKSQPLRVAWLAQGTSNSGVKAQNDATEEAAEELGIELTTFDGQFTPSVQHSQIENVIAGGKFDAIIVQALDGEGECKNLTSVAPSKGILVLPVINPICGKSVARGTDLWAPGTLSMLSGTGSVERWDAYFEKISEELTEPSKILYLSGPLATQPMQGALDSLKAVAAENPNMKIETVIDADYTTATAYTEIQNALLAHPDADTVVSIYTDMTLGALRAIDQSGRDVAVYDAGGSFPAQKLVEDGEIELSMAYLQRTIAVAAVAMIQAAWDGESVPRVIFNDGAKTEGGNAQDSPVFITDDNVDSFTPEY